MDTGHDCFLCGEFVANSFVELHWKNCPGLKNIVDMFGEEIYDRLGTGDED